MPAAAPLPLLLLLLLMILLLLMLTLMLMLLAAVLMLLSAVCCRPQPERLSSGDYLYIYNIDTVRALLRRQPTSRAPPQCGSNRGCVAVLAAAGAVDCYRVS